MSRRSGRLHAVRRRLRRVALPLLSNGLIRVFGRLSWRRAQALGRGLGRLAWVVAGRERSRIRRHLALAFPGWAPGRIDRVGKACLRHHGMNLAECLHLLSRSPEEAAGHVEVAGWEEVEAARAAGRPLLLLTAHLGNWELLGAVASTRGVDLWAVVRGLDEAVLQQTLDRLRRHLGSRLIERGAPGSAKKLLTALREGGAMTLLIDQDIDAEGVFVPFFGRLAHTPVGAAKMALKQDAAVVPAFFHRLPDGSHRARFLPPVPLPEDRDPTTLTAAMTAAIEAAVRQAPEQWVWMHKRWRRRPPGDPRTDA
jgi:Kdo2-lipid IVA lauroyltransferase/acyltransferase